MNLNSNDFIIKNKFNRFSKAGFQHCLKDVVKIILEKPDMRVKLVV